MCQYTMKGRYLLCFVFDYEGRCEKDIIALVITYLQQLDSTEFNVCHLFETVHFPTCFWQSNDFVAKSYLQSLAAAMGRD